MMTREATVKEVLLNSIEKISGSEVMDRIGIDPTILGSNWKTLNTKFEYLASRGFTNGEM